MVERRAIKAATFSFSKWGWVREAGAADGLIHLRTSLGRHGEEAALLLTRRMKWVLVWAIGLGGAAAGLGHIAAITVPGWILGGGLDTSSAGMMAVITFVLFLVAAFAAPGRGVLARRWATRRDRKSVG